MKTAFGSLHQSLGIWIQNQKTMQNYPDSEDKSQSMAVNAMRIEAAIRAIHTTFSEK